MIEKKVEELLEQLWLESKNKVEYLESSADETLRSKESINYLKRKLKERDEEVKEEIKIKVRSGVLSEDKKKKLKSRLERSVQYMRLECVTDKEMYNYIIDMWSKLRNMVNS